MIDLKDLRDNPDKYRDGATAKNYDAALVDQLLAVDAQLRAAQHERELLTAEKNKNGKAMGPLMGQMKKAEGDDKAALEQKIESLRADLASIKDKEHDIAARCAELEPQRDALWLEVPQPADADVPRGTSADDNVELSIWHPESFDPRKGFAEQKGFEPKSHIDLMKALGMVDFERGTKLTGSRGYVLTGAGFQMHNALLRYAFDFMTLDNGFRAMSAPCIVREDTMVGTGFFPHGKDTAYHIANPTSEDEFYLTGTGEVGLMGLHAGEIVDAEALPLCYTTVSTCFRREAGAAGKDTAGLYRIHQFDKVEQVVICKADEAESRAWHTKMIGFVQTLLQNLGLPYRLLQCCTADLGPKNADMIDLECWMPSRGEDGTGDWGETHSASRLYDYQTRRLNVRYKDPETGKNTIAHSLNNTVAASPRILIPIVEMYQNEDGSITVPQALRPHMNGIERIG